MAEVEKHLDIDQQESKEMGKEKHSRRKRMKSRRERGRDKKENPGGSDKKIHKRRNGDRGTNKKESKEATAAVRKAEGKKVVHIERAKGHVVVSSGKAKGCTGKAEEKKQGRVQGKVQCKGSVAARKSNTALLVKKTKALKLSPSKQKSAQCCKTAKGKQAACGRKSNSRRSRIRRDSSHSDSCSTCSSDSYSDSYSDSDSESHSDSCSTCSDYDTGRDESDTCSCSDCQSEQDWTSEDSPLKPKKTKAGYKSRNKV